MISRVKEAIQKGSGYILDFHMFSNRSICLNFELPLGKIGKLRDELRATGLLLDDASLSVLDPCSRRAEQLSEKESASEVSGTLKISFIHNDPDLRIEVPPIPG